MSQVLTSPVAKSLQVRDSDSKKTRGFQKFNKGTPQILFMSGFLKYMILAVFCIWRGVFWQYKVLREF